MGTSALQLLSLEQTMTIPVKKMCRRLSMFAVCILISGWLAAQTDATKNTGSTITSSATSVR